MHATVCETGHGETTDSGLAPLLRRSPRPAALSDACCRFTSWQSNAVRLPHRQVRAGASHSVQARNALSLTPSNRPVVMVLSLVPSMPAPGAALATSLSPEHVDASQVLRLVRPVEGHYRANTSPTQASATVWSYGMNMHKNTTRAAGPLVSADELTRVRDRCVQCGQLEVSPVLCLMCMRTCPCLTLITQRCTV